MGLFSGKRPGNLGVTNGQLAALPKKPNCVSSQSGGSKQRVEPIKGSIAQAAAVLRETDGVEIIEQRDDYLYAECSTPTVGFVDDLELLADGDKLQVRSASRLGYSDWGVNRKRVEALRAKLA